MVGQLMTHYVRPIIRHRHVMLVLRPMNQIRHPSTRPYLAVNRLDFLALFSLLHNLAKSFSKLPFFVSHIDVAETH